MELPPALQVALNAELEHMSTGRLAASAAALSVRYRTGTPASGGAFARTADEIAAYAATRLPATYAAIAAALAQTRARLPGWAPRTLVDVGAGPGTATWAAAATWPQLERATLVEREPEMVALGRRLAAHAGWDVLRAATWEHTDLTGAWGAAPPDRADDLVIAAYLLGELPPERVAPLMERLWQRAGGVLLLVEPGTPAGFARIRAARDQLLAASAHTIAPCPHDHPCPMPPDGWCHFAQRIARTRQHRQAKAGALGYEDEKFAFAALARQPGSPIAARVIRHPRIRPGQIHLELCAPGGLATQTVTRRDRERFRQARDLRWGAAIPESPSST